MANDKTICLCVIVKNEEKTLPRLIKSCKHILDYWIIIDTGSTDKTIEVIHRDLKGVDGELHESEFINFGHNRTELVQKAKGKADYLLLMDADMIVNIDAKFDKAVLDADMYQIRYTGIIDFAQPLFVSGTKNWYYEGYTHEYLNTKEPFNQTFLAELTVTHKADGGTRSDKYTRDVELLEQEIKDKPHSMRPHFYLAQTLQNLKEYEKSIESYQNRLKFGGWQEEVYYSLYQIGVNLYNLKDYDSAILQFAEAYNLRPIRFEALFMAGLIYRERKKYSMAKIYFEKIVKMPYPKDDILFIHRIQYDYLADFELGICNYWIGNYKDAEKHAKKVLNRKDVDTAVKTQNEQNYKFIKEKLALKKAKKNDIYFVSMYTEGTPYQEESKILQNSFKKFNIPHEIYGVKPQGSWVKNTHLKPSLILDAMQKHNKDIIWVDCDAEILQEPSWFNHINCDIAYHTIMPRKEMLTGTVYFKNCGRIKDFLQRWHSLNAVSKLPDAMNFQALMERENFLRIEDMPPEYVKIFDSKEMGNGQPVIIHNQASRRFKQIVNTGKDPDNLIYTLFDHLKNGQESCAVIGNGPFKSDLSTEIDTSFVMRCNNFKIGPGYEKIGERVDINISSLYHEIMPTDKVDYPIFGILPISDVLYQKYTDAKEMHVHWRKNSSEAIDRGNTVWTYNEKDDFGRLFIEIASKIDAFPTVGIMGIAAARELGYKKIILSGFTFFQTSQSHYWTDKKVIPSTHHNIPAERKLLQHWIDNDDIEYVLDEVLKENLYQDETVGRNATQ